MKIDSETVKKIAFLSRINVDDNFDNTKKDFENILGLIEQFNEVETKDVEPLISVNDQNIICRVDEVTDGGNADAVMANAPSKEFGYFIVPKVID